MKVPNDIDGPGLLLRREVAPVRVPDDAEGIITGRLVPYEVITELVTGVREVFHRGAFARQVKASNAWGAVKLLYSHDPGDVPLGRAVHLEERDDGLYGEFRLNTELIAEPGKARQVWLALRAGDLNELSIGFKSVGASGTRYERHPDDSVTLHRQRAHLGETSIVPYGAYGRHATILAVRDSAADLREQWAARIASLR